MFTILFVLYPLDTRNASPHHHIMATVKASRLLGTYPGKNIQLRNYQYVHSKIKEMLALGLNSIAALLPGARERDYGGQREMVLPGIRTLPQLEPKEPMDTSNCSMRMQGLMSLFHFTQTD